MSGPGGGITRLQIEEMEERFRKSKHPKLIRGWYEFVDSGLPAMIVGMGIIVGGLVYALFIRDNTNQNQNSGYTKTSKLELKIQNVIGNKTPEKFYEINGGKYFTEIDGKKVEDYFSNK